MNTVAGLLEAVSHHVHKFWDPEYKPEEDQELTDLVGDNSINIGFISNTDVTVHKFKNRSVKTIQHSRRKYNGRK